LLLSKGRKETAKAAWEIIERAKEGIGAYEVIQGCADDWRWHTDRPGGETIDIMARANIAIAGRVAGQSSRVLQQVSALIVFDHSQKTFLRPKTFQPISRPSSKRCKMQTRTHVLWLILQFALYLAVSLAKSKSR